MEQQSELQEKINYKLEKFEGPLDLLLFLIKKAEVNIYDIPISQITEQYLEYLEYVTKIDLENITEFYTMAATLLYIKSRMLLPIETNLDDEIEDPRQELVEKLIEYQKFKKLTELITEKETDWLIERKKNQKILPFAEDDFWEQAQIWDLLQIFSGIVNSLTTERIIDLYEEVTINEKITLIRELIDTQGEFLFTDLLKRENSIYEVICAFLAILELSKFRQIVVYQNRLFGDIRIKAYDKVPYTDKDSSDDSGEIIEPAESVEQLSGENIQTDEESPDENPVQTDAESEDENQLPIEVETGKESGISTGEYDQIAKEVAIIEQQQTDDPAVTEDQMNSEEDVPVEEQIQTENQAPHSTSDPEKSE